MTRTWFYGPYRGFQVDVFMYISSKRTQQAQNEMRYGAKAFMVIKSNRYSKSTQYHCRERDAPHGWVVTK